MKKIIFALTILIIASCSQKLKTNYPYKYVSSKEESSGQYTNKMSLYIMSGEINIDTLKMFCQERKEEISEGAFHYFVFFDSEEYVKFPNNPFTAFYGIDENTLKHIKAYFEYNYVNGYSKLHVFEKNSLESTPNTIDL